MLIKKYLILSDRYKAGEDLMITLSTSFSDREKNILRECAGDHYEVLSYIEGESYVLCSKGDYCYNECFEFTDVEFFAKQRYEKVFPYRIIKFYHFYLMNTKDDPNSWYRGHRDSSGNWEYDSVADSLDEMFDSL